MHVMLPNSFLILLLTGRDGFRIPDHKPYIFHVTRAYDLYPRRVSSRRDSVNLTRSVRVSYVFL